MNTCVYISLPEYVASFLRYKFGNRTDCVSIPPYYPVAWKDIYPNLSKGEVEHLPTLDELLSSSLVNNVGLYESKHLYPLAFSQKAVEYTNASEGKDVNGHIPTKEQLPSLVPFILPEVVHTAKGWIRSSTGYLTMECKAGNKFQKACLSLFKKALKDYLHTYYNSDSETSIVQVVRSFCRHHRFSADTTEEVVDSLRQAIYRWGLKP